MINDGWKTNKRPNYHKGDTPYTSWWLPPLATNNTNVINHGRRTNTFHSKPNSGVNEAFGQNKSNIIILPHIWSQRNCQYYCSFNVPLINDKDLGEGNPAVSAGVPERFGVVYQKYTTLVDVATTSIIITHAKIISFAGNSYQCNNDNFGNIIIPQREPLGIIIIKKNMDCKWKHNCYY